MIKYLQASHDSDLLGILKLQKANLPEHISKEEYTSQGFVTLRHDLEILREMNDYYPHVIAKDGQAVIGYTLVTTMEVAQKIPLLKSTLDHINKLNYDGCLLSEYRCFIMGQVCVAKPYRGKGVFAALYVQLEKEMKQDFDFIITEIAVHNTRSIHAHQKAGFSTILIHIEDEIEWAIVLLDLRK